MVMVRGSCYGDDDVVEDDWSFELVAISSQPRLFLFSCSVFFAFPPPALNLPHPHKMLVLDAG